MADDFAKIEAAILRVIFDVERVRTFAHMQLKKSDDWGRLEGSPAKWLEKRWPEFIDAASMGLGLLEPATPWIVHPGPVDVFGRQYASYSEGVLQLRANLMLDIWFEGGILAGAFAKDAAELSEELDPLDLGALKAAVSCELRQARQRMIAEGKEPVFWSPYRSVGEWVKLLDTSEKSFQRDRAKRTYVVHPVSQGNDISIRLDTLPTQLRDDRQRTSTGQFSAN